MLARTMQSSPVFIRIRSMPLRISSLDLPRDMKMRLVVTDILGRSVYETANQTYSAGHHEVELNAAHLSSGVYFVNAVGQKNTMQVKRICLIR